MNGRGNYIKLMDEPELVVVDLIGVLERLRKRSRDILSREDSSPVRCKYPDYMGFLCDNIGIREDISLHRVYRSLVKVGFGIKYKNEDEHMLRVIEMIKSMRASGKLDDMIMVKNIDDAISFRGTTKLFRYENEFIAHMSDCARGLNIDAPDIYLYYCLVGLCAVGDLDEYDHFKDNVLFMKALYELKKTEANFKFVASFMDEYL